jgi:hypothetical protein
VGIYFINDLLKDDGIFFTFQEFQDGGMRGVRACVRVV